jgi:hypothetical protein
VNIMTLEPILLTLYILVVTINYSGKA